jgi:hypothetical protein
MIIPVIGPKDTAGIDVFKVTFGDYERYLPYIYKSVADLQIDDDDDDDYVIEEK